MWSGRDTIRHGSRIGTQLDALLLRVIGWLQNVVRPDDALVRTAVAVDSQPRLAAVTANLRFHDMALLGLLGAGGAVVYGAGLIGSLRLCGVDLPPRRGRRMPQAA